jgi:hypothetical protein
MRNHETDSFRKISFKELRPGQLFTLDHRYLFLLVLSVSKRKRASVYIFSNKASNHFSSTEPYLDFNYPLGGELDQWLLIA